MFFLFWVYLKPWQNLWNCLWKMVMGTCGFYKLFNILTVSKGLEGMCCDVSLFSIFWQSYKIFNKTTTFCFGSIFLNQNSWFFPLHFSPKFPLNKSRSIYFLLLVNMIYWLLEEKKRRNTEKPVVHFLLQ